MSVVCGVNDRNCELVNIVCKDQLETFKRIIYIIGTITDAKI